MAKAAESIDCWLGLMHGEQVEFMAEKGSGWMEQFLSQESRISTEQRMVQ